MHLILILVIAIVSQAHHALAENPESDPEQMETSQYDAYYNAMLRSINLDRTRWKPLGRSVVSGPWFYDARGISRKNGKLTVEITAYPNPSRSEIYSSVYSDHTKIRRMVFVTEIQCSRRRYRQPLITVYGYDEAILATHSYDRRKQPYSPIMKDSTIDTLSRIACDKVTGRK